MPRASPTLLQLVGLGITLAAVAIFSLYALEQIQGLERLQADTVDRSRRDSLQLVRVQNDLNQLGLTLRDMIERTEPYPLATYRPGLDRLRADLEDALAREGTLAPASRTPAQQSMLQGAMDRFWKEADLMLSTAAGGNEKEALQSIRVRLEPERGTMSTTISRFLIANNEAEERAAAQIQGIYAGVRRNIFLFLGAVLLAIALTSFYVIRTNRRLFDHLAEVSEERRILAGKVITVQEDVFRSLAREIHDEVGQVLTALGVMVARAERKIQPEDSPIRADLREVREIANQTLERARTMSQMLHPPVLDDYGLEKSIEWYLGQFGKQTGIQVNYEKLGTGPVIGDVIAIHVYRILQESLNNVVRHAQVNEVKVRVSYTPSSLELTVTDGGRGLPPKPSGGIGLIAMRERAELLGGSLTIASPAEGGTRVSLFVPLASGQDV
jgi:signal transduction histidine kinase